MLQIELSRLQAEATTERVIEEKEIQDVLELTEPIVGVTSESEETPPKGVGG